MSEQLQYVERAKAENGIIITTESLTFLRQASKYGLNAKSLLGDKQIAVKNTLHAFLLYHLRQPDSRNYLEEMTCENTFNHALLRFGHTQITLPEKSILFVKTFLVCC